MSMGPATLPSDTWYSLQCPRCLARCGIDEVLEHEENCKNLPDTHTDTVESLWAELDAEKKRNTKIQQELNRSSAELDRLVAHSFSDKDPVCEYMLRKFGGGAYCLKPTTQAKRQEGE